MGKICVMCLFWTLGLWGCDDNGGRRTLPTPTPAPTPTLIPECIDPHDDLVFRCPTDILVQVCENQGFACNFFRIDLEEDLLPRPDLFGIFSPQGSIFKGEVIDEPCVYTGCFTMECDTLVEDQDRRMIGHRRVTFSDILLLGELQGGREVFTAKADVEDFGVFNSVGCGPIIP